MKIFLRLCYIGVDFHGFQIQNNCRTVAGELKVVSDKIFGVPCRISGCSRTDAGVHALDFYASVEPLDQTFNRIPCERLRTIYNFLLPEDISVIEAYPTTSFNPRKSAVKKKYEYRILDGGQKDPFEYKRVYRHKLKLNVPLMNKAAKQLIGEHDFKAFSSTGSERATTVRTIYSAYVTRCDKYVTFFIEGNGFLYNMVRIIVGTLLYISDGKLNESVISNAFTECDRTLLGITAPPDGLYLSQVTLDKEYPKLNGYD